MNDAGILQDAGIALGTASSGSVSGILSNVGMLLSRFGGLTPDVASQIGKKLTATNPQTARQFVDELRLIDSKRIGGEKKAALVRDALTRIGIIQTQSLPAGL